MGSKTFLGEFEQMVLLSVLKLGKGAYGLEAREELERATGRTVSRGAFYTTLDRLTKKGYLTWNLEAASPERGGLPRRQFEVTDQGISALRQSKDALVTLWSGLEEVLG